jgi:hypothetical protein
MGKRGGEERERRQHGRKKENKEPSIISIISPKLSRFKIRHIK